MRTTKRLLFYAMLLSVSFLLVFTTGCEEDEALDEDKITVKFANRFDSTYEITGFWLQRGAAWDTESMIPDGQTLEPGKYFVFSLPKDEEFHYYRVQVEHGAESVILDEYMGHGLSISTFVGEENIRYARLRILGDSPGITFVGCSSIGYGDFWDDEYEEAQW